ncbi:MAG: hypothetical protein ACOVVK_22825 [Elsteraceae bacterium]
MRRVYLGLVALAALQIPIALYAFLAFFKSMPPSLNDGLALDLRVVAHLIWPVACLMGPFLARFPARRGSIPGTLALGLAPAFYGVALTLSGL